MRSDWQGHRDGRERNMRWTHPELTGIEVRHCGHPTAIRPYYVVGRPFARKYTHLAVACQAALTGDEWPDQEPGSERKPQLLIPGVEPIGDRQRIELRGRKPLRGGNAPPPAGGLFDLDARAQGDLLDKAS